MSILVLLTFCLIGFSVGSFLFFKPERSIDIQRRFYELINWKIEPVSIRKEIRNTRIMGAILVIIVVLISFYTLCF